jgi:3-dehydroquinate synthetase
MKHDKKRNQQGFRIAVVSAPGKPLLVEGITDEHIVNALHFYNSSFS